MLEFRFKEGGNTVILTNNSYFEDENNLLDCFVPADSFGINYTVLICLSANMSTIQYFNSFCNKTLTFLYFSSSKE